MSRRENKKRRYKVMFNMKPNGSYTPRITVPITLLRDIGVGVGDHVVYTRVENGILIKKEAQS